MSNPTIELSKNQVINVLVQFPPRELKRAYLIQSFSLPLELPEKTGYRQNCQAYPTRYTFGTFYLHLRGARTQLQTTNLPDNSPYPGLT